MSAQVVHYVSGTIQLVVYFPDPRSSCKWILVANYMSEITVREQVNHAYILDGLKA